MDNSVLVDWDGERLPGEWIGVEVDPSVPALIVAGSDGHVFRLVLIQWGGFQDAHRDARFVVSDLPALLRAVDEVPDEATRLVCGRGMYELARDNRLLDLSLAGRLLHLAGRPDPSGLRNPAALIRWVGDIGYLPAPEADQLPPDPAGRAQWGAAVARNVWAEMTDVAAAAGVPADRLAAAGPLAIGTQVRGVVAGFLSGLTRLALPRAEADGMGALAKAWRDRAFRELCRDSDFRTLVLGGREPTLDPKRNRYRVSTGTLGDWAAREVGFGDPTSESPHQIAGKVPDRRGVALALPRTIDRAGRVAIDPDFRGWPAYMLVTDGLLAAAEWQAAEDLVVTLVRAKGEVRIRCKVGLTPRSPALERLRAGEPGLYGRFVGLLGPHVRVSLPDLELRILAAVCERDHPSGELAAAIRKWADPSEWLAERLFGPGAAVDGSGLTPSDRSRIARALAGATATGVGDRAIPAVARAADGVDFLPAAVPAWVNALLTTAMPELGRFLEDRTRTRLEEAVGQEKADEIVALAAHPECPGGDRTWNGLAPRATHRATFPVSLSRFEWPGPRQIPASADATSVPGQVLTGQGAAV